MNRRSKPRIWHADWLVLRPLALVISTQVQLHTKHATRLLDFGCGDMPYRSMLERLGVQYCGADLGGRADLIIDESGRVPLPACAVDVVLSSQVLEHVPEVKPYLSETRRLLVDSGLLLLSTHGTWPYHPHPGDYRRWTSTGLIFEIESNGFLVEEIIPIVGPLATTTLIRLTGYVFVLNKIPLFGPIASFILAIIMNIRAILEDYATPKNIIRNDACVYFVRARPNCP